MQPSTSPASTVAQRLTGRRAQIGSGLAVTRLLPATGRRTIGAWCFLDHAGPAELAPGAGMRVGPHPHIGLQTFTWMIAGEVLHRDSLGHTQLIRPGQVNLMTAGRGITHSEESPGDRGGPLHAAQLWIALPESERRRAPDFTHYPELPTAALGGFRATLLVGRALGLTAPTRVYSPLLGIDLAAADAVAARVPLEPAFEHGLVCLRGALRIDGTALAPGALLYLPPGREGVDLDSPGPAQALLIGGAPFTEPVLMWWNFVARTQDEIAAATEDWNAGRRFGPVAGTALARLHAPDVAGLRLHG